MSYLDLDLRPVAERDEATRADFIVRVYQHLLGAVAAFIALEALIFATPIAEAYYDLLSRASASWLLVLGAFMVGQWVVGQAAMDLLNPARQYQALAGMVVLETLIFTPFLYYAFAVQNAGTTVAAAGLLTIIGFVGLSVVAFVTRRDLSLLRPVLMFAGVAALVLIVGAVIFGFELGVWFSVAMIALAGGSILYQTHSIIHRYPPQAHVAAALGLFASVMMLFWYVLRLLLRR